MMKEYKTQDDFEMKATAGFEIVLVDEGLYDAELSSIVKVKDVKVTRDGIAGVIGTIDMLRWTFTIFDGIKLSGISLTEFSPKSKAFKWASKLLDRDIKIGEIIKPKDIVGKSCQVVIKNFEKEVEFEGKKRVHEYSRVDMVVTTKKNKNKR